MTWKYVPKFFWLFLWQNNRKMRFFVYLQYPIGYPEYQEMSGGPHVVGEPGFGLACYGLIRYLIPYIFLHFYWSFSLTSVIWSFARPSLTWTKNLKKKLAASASRYSAIPPGALIAKWSSSPSHSIAWLRRSLFQFLWIVFLMNLLASSGLSLNLDLTHNLAEKLSLPSCVNRSDDFMDRDSSSWKGQRGEQAASVPLGKAITEIFPNWCGRQMAGTT